MHATTITILVKMTTLNVHPPRVKVSMPSCVIKNTKFVVHSVSFAQAFYCSYFFLLFLLFMPPALGPPGASSNRIVRPSVCP